jgi:hypothetical protein
MVAVGRRCTGHDTVKVLGVLQGRLCALAPSIGAPKIIGLMMRPPVIRLNDLFAYERFDVDSPIRKVIDNLRLPQKGQSTVPIVPIVGADSRKVQRCAVVELVVVYA